MNSKIKVSGNIIGELSEKIPSNIIALNELIKNSYDAGGKNVSIVLNTVDRTLIVSDDGAGMDRSDIDTLFHISNSKKRYGELNQYKRYTQGSKGLGFLSVFKFGEKVEWKTRKDIGLKFAVNYSDLIYAYDISEFEIEVVEDDAIKQGTTIIISLNEYNTVSLQKYLSEEKNYKKVVNAFVDDNFIINLQVDGDKYSSVETLPLIKNSIEHQLYYVTYDSKSQKINYYYNNCFIISEDFEFNSTAYALEIELVIFQFPPYGKGKVDQLFVNPHGDLTPLVYVNSNLFNNFDLFDPNIMKNIKTSQVLNQMIGFIKIISNDSKINFNSDRSQFLQNELTDSIKDFLSNINKKTQEVGSIYKKYLMNFDILTVNELPEDCRNSDIELLRKYIKSDFKFKSNVEIKRSNDKVTYALFGKEAQVSVIPKEEAASTNISDNQTKASNNDDDKEKGQEGNETNSASDTNSPTKVIPATIKLKCKYKEIGIPSSQIDLSKYIATVNDSSANSVNVDNVDITVDGVILHGKILSSIANPCVKHVEYRYLDSKTGLAIETLTLSFFQQVADIDFDSEETKLIALPSNKSYTISYNPYVGKLIAEINSLDINVYKEVIACSLRAIFDLSIDSLHKSTKYSNLFTGVSKFEDRVVKVVEYIKGTKKFVSEISKSTKIDYHSLENMLDAESFRSGISTAHLAAHKATAYISDTEITHLAKLLGIFVVIVNEMLNNTNVTWLL